MINFLSTNDRRDWFTHVDTKEKATHFLHKYFVSGDYCGSGVEASNRKVLLENTELCERLGIEELHESYSTDSLLFPIASLNDPELKEIFERLEKYPCLDDEAMSEVENELEEDCFVSFGRTELKEYLRVNDLITDEQHDDITNDQLNDIYHKASQNTNYNIFTVESGTSGFFDFKSFGGLYDKAQEMLKPIISEVLKWPIIT